QSVTAFPATAAHPLTVPLPQPVQLLLAANLVGALPPEKQVNENVGDARPDALPGIGSGEAQVTMDQNPLYFQEAGLLTGPGAMETSSVQQSLEQVFNQLERLSENVVDSMPTRRVAPWVVLMLALATTAGELARR